MKAISLQLRNQSTVKLLDQNLFISIRSCIFDLLIVPDWYPLKLLDLLVLTVQNSMFNMNFTKDLFLCEIIEQHKGKTFIVVVKKNIVGLSYRMTVLTVMVCA